MSVAGSAANKVSTKALKDNKEQVWCRESVSAVLQFL